MIVTIIGLSTEGYQIARNLISNNITTFIIDEKLMSGIEVNKDIINKIDTIDKFYNVKLKTDTDLNKFITKSNFIFFIPKIKNSDTTYNMQISNTLKIITQNLDRGKCLIFSLSIGLGQNTELIKIIERTSGLYEGKDFNYIYLPLEPRSTENCVIGINQNNIPTGLKSVLNYSGIKILKYMSIESAELYFCSNILNKYVKYSTSIEFWRRSPQFSYNLNVSEQLESEICYLDEFIENYFDFKELSKSLDQGDPLLNLTNGINKTIDNFIKRLVERVRTIFKEKKLRASNTKITLIWTIDTYEMRGSKQNIKEHIIDKLKDYIGDVTLFRLPILSNIIPNKNNLLIFCSKEDFKLYSSDMKKKFESDIISLKANYMLEVVE